MKIFVKYNADGAIISVSKVEVMPEDLEQPYSELEPGANVLEVIPVTEELEELDALQIHSSYRVDVEAKTLVKKT
ncbi:MAG: hypothetical protein Fur006_37600 [Coleofasciculaceae cyanobacterium]